MSEQIQDKLRIAELRLHEVSVHCASVEHLRDELLTTLRELRRQCMEGTTQRELIDAAIAKAESQS